MNKFIAFITIYLYFICVSYSNDYETKFQYIDLKPVEKKQDSLFKYDQDIRLDLQVGKINYASQSPSENASARLTLASGIIYDEKWAFYPLFRYGYSQSQTKLNDLSSRFTNQYYDIHLEPLFRYFYDGNSNIYLGIFEVVRDAIEATNEKRGTGLYDYVQRGFRIGAEIYKDKSSFKIGYMNFLKKYPNFDIEDVFLDGVPEQIVDYRGNQFWAVYQHYLKKISLTHRIDVLHKSYRDQVVEQVDEFGIQDTSDVKRKDLYLKYKLDTSALLIKNWEFGVALEFAVLESNQNFYDDRNTIPPADDVFTRDFYDFKQYKISPYLRWYASEKSIFTLTYSYDYQKYNTRKAQFIDGTYSKSNMWQRTHYVGLNYSYNLLKDKVYWFVDVFYEKAVSNMKFQQFYSFEYEIFGVSSGFQIKF